MFETSDMSKIEQKIVKIERLEEVLLNNSTFDSNESSGVVFPQVFIRSLFSLFLLKVSTDSGFERLLDFVSNIDFKELFIQTSWKTISQVKGDISTLSQNLDYQYLLLTYLTGNKAIGNKQWKILVNVLIKWKGHNVFQKSYGEPLPDDRNRALSESLRFGR